MKSNKLKYLVAIALIINAATLIFFWYNRPPEGEGNRPHKEPSLVLVDVLKLDEKQKVFYLNLRDRHHQAHDSLLLIIATKRQILYSQKQEVNDTILQQIGLLQNQIEYITYEHLKELRQICTPQQQAQLDSVLEKTVQRIFTPKDKKRPYKDER